MRDAKRHLTESVSAGHGSAQCQVPSLTGQRQQGRTRIVLKDKLAAELRLAARVLGHGDAGLWRRCTRGSERKAKAVRLLSKRTEILDVMFCIWLLTM